jgi:hypothetical protein
VVPDVSYGSLPFAEQIAFFRRKLNLPTNAWTDIWESEHDHAFVVAGANRDDLVADFRAAIDKAIADGGTLADFRKDFDAIVARYGWDYNGGRNWRSRVIYETNLRSSYAAGRYAQLMALIDVRPYWRYRHSDAVLHPRPLHLAWNGLVIAANDPWWQKHYPPNGWGCQCTVEALNDRDLARLGKDGPDTAPDDGTQIVTVGTRGPSPRTVETPTGVDPGFGYSPGADAWLREQAQRAFQLAEAQAQSDWQPLLQTAAEDLGLPARIPLVPVPVPLGERLDDAAAVTQALRELLGADARVFDVKGLPVIIDAAVLADHIDPSRAEFLPLLLDLLADPFEVWLQIERAALTGAYRVRARIIKGYDLGKGKAVIIAADRQDGSFVGWTFIPARSLNYAQKQRTGMLWWGADEE